MPRIALLLMICAPLLFVGCADGAITAVGSGCTSDDDCQGACVGGQCIEPEVDGNTPEGDVGPSSDAGDGGANNQPDDACETICRAGEECVNGACICIEGSQRVCGLKVGECEYGVQSCIDRVWRVCEGGRGSEPERCDHLDNDCDGIIDEDVTTIFYRDVDNDDYGGDETQNGCDLEDGFSVDSGDCDDNDPAIHPGAEEVCDGIDNDCDLEIDVEDDNFLVPDDLCADQGVCADGGPVCNGTDGWECVYPDTWEPEPETLCDDLDNDCDGQVDEGLHSAWYADIDQDRWGDDDTRLEACTRPESYIGRGGDCDDGDRRRFPGNTEVCDGIDNDCDDAVDDVDDDLTPSPDDLCLVRGVCANGGPVCRGVDGWACTYPDPYERAPETLCDDLDNDCDGQVDEGLRSFWFADVDLDQWGDDDTGVNACRRPDGYIRRGGDCDDNEPRNHPGNREVCDGLDNDCDRAVDTDDETLIPAPDDLCSVRGVCSDTVAVCGGVDGWSCTYPDTFEPEPESLCDDLDNDCDGQVDEGLRGVWFADVDRDQWGDDDTRVEACDPPNGYIRRGGDCDDDERRSYPGNPEVCDGVDNNCVNGVDEGGVCRPPTAICPEVDPVVDGTQVTLMGDGRDPDGGAVTFAWRVVQAPDGSGADVDPNSGRTVSITPDLPGTYLIEMCVTDDEAAQTCCVTTLEVNASCTVPALPRPAACSISWDRRPIVEFEPLPASVFYELYWTDRDQPYAVIADEGQNFHRPSGPLASGDHPDDVQPREISMQACMMENPNCCTARQSVPVSLIEACSTAVSPTPENLIISEYLINGDGGSCPGGTCEAGEALEITNLSHCPVRLEGHHFRYCNNPNCSTYRYMDFGPDDIVPPRGVYVLIRNPDASTCEFSFFGSDDPSLFGLKRSTLEVQGNRTNTSGWFVNSGGGSLRVATGGFVTPNGGQTIAQIEDYVGGQNNCASVGFDAIDSCGAITPRSEPTTRLVSNQLGRLWHPCDSVETPVPDACF